MPLFLFARIANSPILGNAYRKLLFNLAASWRMYGKDFFNAIHTTVQMKMYLVDTFVDPVSEFKRMGVFNSKWRITHINDDYKLCSTYPSILSVPHGISDETIGYTFTTVTLSDPSFIMSINECMYVFFCQPDLPAFARKVGFPRCAG